MKEVKKRLIQYLHSLKRLFPYQRLSSEKIIQILENWCENVNGTGGKPTRC